MVDKLRWAEDEVISFLEDLILDGLETDKELDFYLNYIYNGIFNNKIITYKKIIKKMKYYYYN